MALVLGVRPDIVQAAGRPMFWLKIAFPRPSPRLRRWPRCGCPAPAHVSRRAVMLAAPVLAVWLIAAFALWSAAAAERPALILGYSWAACLVSISFLAAPVLVAMLWAASRAAPTAPPLPALRWDSRPARSAPPCMPSLRRDGGAVSATWYCSE